MNISEKIKSLMVEIAELNEISLNPDISSETILLQSGLDSLGFAILIARLEEDLGYDPFTLMEEPIYPQTFAELVEIYERFAV